VQEQRPPMITERVPAEADFVVVVATGRAADPMRRR